MSAITKLRAEGKEAIVLRSELERVPGEDIDEVVGDDENVSEAMVLDALRSIEVPINENRQNVKLNLDESIRSCTFGALARSNSPARISEVSRRRPRLTRLLARFGHAVCPKDFPFASIQLNKDYASAMHCDSSNDGPSCIYALGDFSGGQLWTQDRGLIIPRNANPEDRVFNGNQPHCTLAFRGERYSLIYFSTAGHDRTSPQDTRILDLLGFKLPSQRLTHTFMPHSFPAPHMEHSYTFGFHVSIEERCDDANVALENWLADWAEEERTDVAAALTALPRTDTKLPCAMESNVAPWTPNKSTNGGSPGSSRSKRKRKSPRKMIDQRIFRPERAAEAFKARSKPGSMAPDDACKGLLLGFARLTSNKHRGDDRDGYLATGAVAQCPLGWRGPLTGVVVYHERCNVQSTINPDQVDSTDIFGILYQDGRFEELELEELAQALEPPPPTQRQRAAASVHIEWSAPELARKMLATKKKVHPNLVGERKLITQRYEASDASLACRTAANAALLNAFDTALTKQREAQPISPYPAHQWWSAWIAAAADLVKPSGLLGNLGEMVICEAMIAAPRILIRSYGGFSDADNALALARAAGLWPPNLPLDFENFITSSASLREKDNRNDSSNSTIAMARKRKREDAARMALRYGVPEVLSKLQLSKARLVLVLLLAIEVRLVRLGFSDGSANDNFKVTLQDLCLSHDERNDKWEEQGPAPLSRPTVVRAVLEREVEDACSPLLEDCNHDTSGMWPSLELRVPMLLENLKSEINRESPPSSWIERYGHIVWIPAEEANGFKETKKAFSGRTGLEGLLRNLDNTTRPERSNEDTKNLIGLTLRRKTLLYGMLIGRVVAAGPEHIGARKYLVEYDDDQGSEWLAESQIKALAVDTVHDNTVTKWKPALILDPSAVVTELCKKHPSAIDPASIAAIGRAARSGYTSWGRVHIQRRVDQALSALHLLSIIEADNSIANVQSTNKAPPTYVLLKDSQCLDWNEGVRRNFFDEANPRHQVAMDMQAKVNAERQVEGVEENEAETHNSRSKRAKSRRSINYNEDILDESLLELEKIQSLDTRHLAEIDARIIYAQVNPKRPGSASNVRYEKYKHATSVQDFLSLGGTHADLRFDHSRGYVTLSDQAAEEPAHPDTSARPSNEAGATLQEIVVDQVEAPSIAEETTIQDTMIDQEEGPSIIQEGHVHNMMVDHGGALSLVKTFPPEANEDGGDDTENSNQAPSTDVLQS